jgi:hypothetical protein
MGITEGQNSLQKSLLAGNLPPRLVRGGLPPQPASPFFARLLVFVRKRGEHAAFSDARSCLCVAKRSTEATIGRLSLRANFGVSFLDCQ